MANSLKVSTEIKKKLKKIKLIVLDFDGVLTDNTVIQNSKGDEFVRRSREDSLGIDLLDQAGLYDKTNYERKDHKIDIMIMSKETNNIVQSVAKKIKLKCLNASEDKVEDLKREIKEREMYLKDICFVGNDLNDLGPMKIVGLAISPKDGVPEVLEEANYITSKRGGKGVLREIIDIILT